MKILSNLDYDLHQPLSVTIDHEKLVKEIISEIKDSCFADFPRHIDNKVKRAQSILLNNSAIGELARLGYDYARVGANPTLAEMLPRVNRWIEPLTEPVSKWGNLSAGQMAVSKLKIRQAIAEKILHIASGYLLYDLQQFMKQCAAIVQKHPIFFPKDVQDLVQFKGRVRRLIFFEQAGMNPLQTLNQLEQQNRWYPEMVKVFKERTTPDQRKTLQLTIHKINEQLKESKTPDTTTYADKFFRKGFDFATLGEDPTLWDALQPDFSMVYEWDTSLTLTEAPDEDMNNAIKGLQKGYATSYFLHFLETTLDQLKLKKKRSSPARMPVILPASVPLKWTGQKNQLYSLLRHLKAEELLTNSYEELAVFLKNHVSCFKETALSTIQKELGKDKQLPKSRRLDIKKFITPDNTA